MKRYSALSFCAVFVLVICFSIGANAQTNQARELESGCAGPH